MTEFAPGGRVPFFYPDLWNYWMHGAGGLHIQSRPSWLFAAFLGHCSPVFLDSFRFCIVFAITKLFCRLLFPLCCFLRAADCCSFGFIFRAATRSIAERSCSRSPPPPPSWPCWILFCVGLHRDRSKHLRFSLPFFSCGLSAFRFSSHVFRASATSKGMRRISISSLRNSRPSIRIASIADEADNLPSFCRRTIIFGVETAVHSIQPDHFRSRSALAIAARNTVPSSLLFSSVSGINESIFGSRPRCVHGRARACQSRPATDHEKRLRFPSAFRRFCSTRRRSVWSLQILNLSLSCACHSRTKSWQSRPRNQLAGELLLMNRGPRIQLDIARCQEKSWKNGTVE